MGSEAAQINPAGLARRLVQDGLLSETRAQTAQTEAAGRRQPFVQYLVEQKVLDSHSIALAASEAFGVPLLDLTAVELLNVPMDLIDARLVRKHRALPLFRRGNRLFVAVSDPTNDRALDEIRFNTDLSVSAVLVEDDKLATAINKTLQAQDSSLSELADAELGEVAEGDPDAGSADEVDPKVDDAPVVRYVNKILIDAINAAASDIHFEPYERYFRIRFRQDGVLQEVANPPLTIASRLIARLKVMSRMNIAERRIPQDGRIRLKLGYSQDVDFRVNTLPTLYGEKVVLRILDSAGASVGVDKLGMDPGQQAIFLRAIKRPYGMILVTGPTGSGKTVTLYSALNLLNETGVNISTVEDPVEIQVAGINQVNMNMKTGLTFAAALRAFLRQDPDILMVGEIRDLETAEIAVKAAQTGHLVLSTLHTNDAPQSLTRLANMGVPPFNIASSVLVIMAQRLARRLCVHCRAVDELPRQTLLEEGFSEHEIDDGLNLYKAVGCERCTEGYKGRIGIFEVVEVSEGMGRTIMEGGNALDLAEQARREGFPDLRQSGLQKVKQGITSLVELNRVTRD
ncbi:type IV-A pilus assembly ATPase PilB [Halochromatium glycolicum]|uniref:Type IV-A pilus assembly ATPase PilB n=1 Tax=Halochromatium glycolicum TaxID=85075 RepID=A0AAJ0U3X1_9GAMM|nr:type IV-A pilus assembly ATPase PilB [Halochromatium glycolicum]MBK1704761.1 type IV-A pilus assembly ATPase PilB [Halochromatium glycolicum]